METDNHSVVERDREKQLWGARNYIIYDFSLILALFQNLESFLAVYSLHDSLINDWFGYLYIGSNPVHLNKWDSQFIPIEFAGSMLLR